MRQSVFSGFESSRGISVTPHQQSIRRCACVVGTGHGHTFRKKTMREEVMQLPVSCMMGSGPVSAKSSISSTHLEAEARHMSIRSGS